MSRFPAIAVYAFTILFFLVFFILPIGLTVKEAFIVEDGFTFVACGSDASAVQVAARADGARLLPDLP